MRNISACHKMRCCHSNGLNPKIDNQKLSLILTVPMLVNLYRENFNPLNTKLSPKNTVLTVKSGFLAAMTLNKPKFC